MFRLKYNIYAIFSCIFLLLLVKIITLTYNMPSFEVPWTWDLTSIHASGYYWINGNDLIGDIDYIRPILGFGIIYILWPLDPTLFTFILAVTSHYIMTIGLVMFGKYLKAPTYVIILTIIFQHMFLNHIIWAVTTMVLGLGLIAIYAASKHRYLTANTLLCILPLVSPPTAIVSISIYLLSRIPDQQQILSVALFTIVFIFYYCTTPHIEYNIFNISSLSASFILLLSLIFILISYNYRYKLHFYIVALTVISTIWYILPLNIDYFPAITTRNKLMFLIPFISPYIIFLIFRQRMYFLIFLLPLMLFMCIHALYTGVEPNIKDTQALNLVEHYSDYSHDAANAALARVKHINTSYSSYNGHYAAQLPICIKPYIWTAPNLNSAYKEIATNSRIIYENTYSAEERAKQKLESSVKCIH